MKCFSIFTGIGGFDGPLTDHNHTIVGACEIDSHARAVFQKHFPDVPLYEDATKIKVQELPDFDLLVGGFPCQSFSIAGHRKGFEDTRGTLFFEIARIAQAKRPRYLLLENVKGLLSHNEGETIRKIFSTLNDLGYDTQSSIINTKDFLPQNRERIFIIGTLRGEPRSKIFPITKNDKINGSPQSAPRGEGKRLRSSHSRAIDANYAKGEGSRTMIKMIQKNNKSTYRIYSPEGIARTLCANSGGGGTKTGVYLIEEKYKMLTERRTEEAKQIRKEHMKNNHKDFSPRRGKELVEREDSLANCVTATQGMESYLTDGSKLRSLTPIECERLQGFPDNYTEGLSDTQRYKCLGNAVSVPVVEHILTLLEKAYNLKP